MSKHTNKHRKLRMHPIHFHVGMYVAIAALLITTMKSSEGIIAGLTANAEHSGSVLHNTFMREAETHVGHAQIVQHRRVYISGV